ncbi:MAG: DUF92 domain-containing protein [Balneolales bacterium]
MPDRLLNYIFGFVLILFFVVFANTDEQTRIFIAFLLTLTVAIVALFMNWLSLDGTFAAFIIGTVTLGLGGIPAAIVLLLFFLSSYLIGTLSTGRTAGNKQMEQERRDGRQVWANAFWFVLFISFGYYFRDDYMMMAAAGSMAVAISDTWATEFGMRATNSKTYFILNFQHVDAGIDGGVSLKGTIGGLLGSLLLSVIYILTAGHYSLMVFLIIGLSGFSGCILDSYLGAIFQTNKKELRFPEKLNIFGKLDNNSVNLVATGYGAVFTLYLFWILK